MFVIYFTEKIEYRENIYKLTLKGIELHRKRKPKNNQTKIIEEVKEGSGDLPKGIDGF